MKRDIARRMKAARLSPLACALAFAPLAAAAPRQRLDPDRLVHQATMEAAAPAEDPTRRPPIRTHEEVSTQGGIAAESPETPMRELLDGVFHDVGLDGNPLV